MTTVLTVHGRVGVVGRCDARCHDATTADCDCICGGRNHGCGTEAAIAHTRDRPEEFTGATALGFFELQHRVGATRVEITPEIAQLGLDIEETGGRQ